MGPFRYKLMINLYSLPALLYVVNFFCCIRWAIDCSSFDCSGYGTVVRRLITANYIVVLEIISVDHLSDFVLPLYVEMT
jgi:hypothetical protein